MRTRQQRSRQATTTAPADQSAECSSGRYSSQRERQDQSTQIAAVSAVVRHYQLAANVTSTTTTDCATLPPLIADCAAPRACVIVAARRVSVTRPLIGKMGDRPYPGALS